MDKNSKSIENYYLDKSSVFSDKFIKSLEEAQLLLMELEKIKEKSTSKEKSKLKKNGTFHKSNIDLSMLLQDTKELEKVYINRKKIEFRKTLPKSVRRSKSEKKWRRSRLEKYTILQESRSDTNNVLQMFKSKSRERLKTDVVKIKFENYMTGVPSDIYPEIFNQGDALNLHEKRISDFENVVGFHKSGIYRIDLDIKKEKKSSHLRAIYSTSFILLLLLI